MRLTAESFEQKAKEALSTPGEERYNLQKLINTAAAQLRKQHDRKLAEQVQIARSMIGMGLV